MFGKVVIDAKRVALAIAEILANRAAGIRSQILHRRGIARGGRHDDGILHRPVFFQRLHDLSDRRSLLADGDVDADDVLPFLIDDGVDRNGGFSSLPITDDQFPLATSDRNHRIDRFQSRL